MPPSQPVLSVSKTSTTSFVATITGDPGVTHRLYYRNLLRPALPDVTGPTRVGNGTLNVTGLVAEAHYQVWVVSDDGASFSLPALSSVSLSHDAGDDVLAAAKAKWYGSPILTSLIPGGLFLNEVPETVDHKVVPLPYAYAEAGGAEFLWSMTEEYNEVSELTFVIFAAGAAVARNCVTQIRTVFDWSELAFTSPSSVTTYLRPSRVEIASEPLRHKDGALIYRASIVYDYWISRSYPLPPSP